MSITRRQFIKRSGLATAGALLGPSLFGNPLVRRALATPGLDRYFIVLFLDGGNDGLNTVTPISNGSGSLRDDYENARDSLRLLPGELLSLDVAGLNGHDPNTGATIGIHPGFGADLGAGAGGLHALYQQGKVAVIQGCGYPRYSLSHDDSRNIWKTANPFGLGAYAGTGWVGRHLAAYYTGSDVPAVCIQGSIAGELRQSSTSVLAVERLRDFNFPYDPNEGSTDDTARRTAFLALCQQHINAAPFNTVGDTGAATLISSESYHNLALDSGKTPRNDDYDVIDRSVARDLREIARIIKGNADGVPNINARYFQLSNGGYDTHSDQKANDPDGQHYSLHAEVGASLKLFFEDLEDIQAGLGDKVTVLVWSEFSRRIKQNDSGTDHGSQGPMFLIGGGVNGGLYGNHPNIAESAWDDEGNSVYKQSGGFRSTDFRDVYGTVLKHWLNMPAAQVSAVLPLDADGGTPADEQWQTANFDMTRPSGGVPLFKP